MIDTKHKLSLNKQLKLLDISKTAHYYEPVIPFSSDEDVKLLNTIDIIHTKHPYYGTRRIVKLLTRVGINVGRKLVKTAMEYMYNVPRKSNHLIKYFYSKRYNNKGTKKKQFLDNASLALSKNK